MRADRAWKDEFTLLCERCGYVVEGLPSEGSCPECGKPIVESLPERRAGTPWQRRTGPRPLVRTICGTLRHPLRTLSVATVDPQRDRKLMWASLGLAGALMSVGWWLPGFVPIASEQPWILFIWALFILVTGVAAALVLSALTIIESWGLRAIARTKHFRISKDLSRTITAHGCTGWVVAGIGFIIANMVGVWIMDASRSSHVHDPSHSELLDQYVAIFGSQPAPWAYHLAWVMRVLAILLGFLLFETFVWLGLRHLKYANRVRPGLPTIEDES